MTDTPPDWVLLEAAKRCGWDNVYLTPTLQHFYGSKGAFRALCDMIAKHEQPPVDRKLLCAREALRLEWKHKQQSTTATGQCVRAIELWIEGYGE